MQMEKPMVNFVPIQLTNTLTTSGASQADCKGTDSDEDCGGEGQPVDFTY